MRFYAMVTRYCTQCKADKLHEKGVATDGKTYLVCLRCKLATADAPAEPSGS